MSVSSYLLRDVRLEEQLRLDGHPVHLDRARRAGRARRQVVRPHLGRVVAVGLSYLQGRVAVFGYVYKIKLPFYICSEDSVGTDDQGGN